MPVKVRCTTCDKVLNAPDAARGKAIKCPGCQGKISVPAEGGGGSSAAPKKAKPKKPVDEDEEFLSSLDLDKSVDAESPVCPKCGADVDVEDIECPSCGVNVQTGQLSVKRQKKAALKGQDPDDYYKKAIPDSWRFMIRHVGYAAQAALFALILGMIRDGLLYGVALIPADKMPPRVFLTAFSVAVALGIPGWYWHVFIATVKHTMARKEQLKDVKFDMVTSMAEGIQCVLWTMVFFLPWFVIGVYVVTNLMGKPSPDDMGGLMLVFAALWAPLAIGATFSAPAFAHLASYSQWRGWLLPVMLAKAAKVPGQCAMFGVTAFIGSLFSVAVVILGIVVCATMYTATIHPILGGMRLLKDAGAGAAEVSYMVMGIALVIAEVYLYSLAFAASLSLLFVARSAGLFAFYCKDKLDIVTRPADEKWVSKARKLDEDGNPITPVWMTIAGIIGVSLLFAVAAYIIMRQYG